MNYKEIRLSDDENPLQITKKAPLKSGAFISYYFLAVKFRLA
jgi:hypothetical protein